MSAWTAGGYSTTNVTSYAWDGWLPVAEISGSTTNFFTYGADVGGGLQTAGGVGGLVVVSLGGTNCLPVFNGNGDVMGLVKADDGTLVAEYEYSPAGETLKCEGDLAKANHMRFSTKFFDDTGLSIYPVRPYSPRHQGFLSRDLIGERGGVNIHGLCGNDLVNWTDAFGLFLIAFDGTGNNKDARKNAPTNVQRLWEAYNTPPGKYYIRGVGSSDTMLYRYMENPSGGLTGLGGKQRIAEAWRAVLDHYRGMSDDDMQKDPLDLIGFSRGAALARDFANAVHSRGDPRKFRREVSFFGNSMIESRMRMEGCPLRIRFLGIFDTVPSFGKPGDHSDPGYSFSIPPNVENVRHASARDEERSLFPLANIAISPNRIEKMFPGVHSDVGGGYGENFDIQYGPLLWMWQEGLDVGVPWDMPTAFNGWTPPTGTLKGHQSNISNPLADHPEAEWDPVSPTDVQKRPVWIP